MKLLEDWKLDGLDIDLEDADRTKWANTPTMRDLVTSLTGATPPKLVTLAPEAATVSMNDYASLIPLASWTQVQFYNNMPDWLGRPWNPGVAGSNWQVDYQDQAGWLAVLTTDWTAKTNKALTSDQIAMLMPAGPGRMCAGSPYGGGPGGVWNVSKLMETLSAGKVAHAGVWDVACDASNTPSYAFATAMDSVLAR